MSLKQPVWHVLVLGMLTFKIYLVYWAYKNWRDLSEQQAKVAYATADAARGESIHTVDSVELKTADLKTVDSNTSQTPALDETSHKPSLVASLMPKHLESFRDCSPHIRALFWLFPYANDYLFFTLSSGIAKLQNKTSFLAKHPVIWAFALTVASFTLSYLVFLKGAFYLLFLLSVLPAAVVQHSLNKYWDSVEKPGLLTRHGFSGKELVAIIAGALYMGYILCSFLLLDQSKIQ